MQDLRLQFLVQDQNAHFFKVGGVLVGAVVDLAKGTNHICGGLALLELDGVGVALDLDATRGRTAVDARAGGGFVGGLGWMDKFVDGGLQGSHFDT